MRFETLLERVRSVPPSARAIALIALAAIVLAGVAGAVATRDTRVALFAAPLRPDQLAEVEQRLAAWNIPHLSGPDNVRVDARKRGSLLLRLALAGVPHAHLAGSDETLAHAGALTPQTVLEAQTREALSADLALALRGVEGVSDARVVIAPASGGIYADEPRRDASASVRVTLAPGARLAARAIAGIKAFVAGGVPGLDAERVTVLDDRGIALDAEAAPDAGDVQLALQSALDGAFGAGATIVRVHRETLGERRELHVVRRAALEGPLARSTSDERYASSAKHYSKTSATDERGSDVRDERRIADPGATARLSVAVFVDAARGLDVVKIRQLAAATAGIRADRGDALSVEAIAFKGTTVRPPRGPRVPGWILAFAGLLPQVLTGGAVVLVTSLAARPLAAALVRAADARAVRAAAGEVRGIAPERVRRALEGEPPHVAAAVIAGLPAATATAVLDLYAAAERGAIVARLSRANGALVPAADELVR